MRCAHTATVPKAYRHVNRPISFTRRTFRRPLQAFGRTRWRKRYGIQQFHYWASCCGHMYYGFEHREIASVILSTFKHDGLKHPQHGTLSTRVPGLMFTFVGRGSIIAEGLCLTEFSDVMHVLPRLQSSYRRSYAAHANEHERSTCSSC